MWVETIGTLVYIKYNARTARLLLLLLTVAHAARRTPRGAPGLDLGPIRRRRASPSVPFTAAAARTKTNTKGTRLGAIPRNSQSAAPGRARSAARSSTLGVPRRANRLKLRAFGLPSRLRPHQSASMISGWPPGAAPSVAPLKPSPVTRLPGVAGAGLGPVWNSHLRRQIGHVFLLCNHVVMHIR